MSAEIWPPDVSLLTELGARIAQVRVGRNATQAELAHEAGVSKRTIERLEAGESIQLASLLRVFRALGLTPQLIDLLPAAVPSPMQQLRGKGRTRKRARAVSTDASAKASAWSWDDEP